MVRALAEQAAQRKGPAITVLRWFLEGTIEHGDRLVLASRGLTNGEIADQLFLSPRTVASHL